MNKIVTVISVSILLIAQNIYGQQSENTVNKKSFTSLESIQGQEEYVYNLDLSGTKLKSIPEVVFDLRKLETLNLSNTGLKIIPDEIVRLSNLKKINIGHLQTPNKNLKSLTPNLSYLSNLEEFILNGNPNLDWTLVFEQLSDIQSLKIVAIMNNDIRNLSGSITDIKSLEQVWLGQNTELNIPLTLELLDQLPKLKHLGLGGIGIKAISFEEHNFRELENLWLSGNQITSLEGLENITNLESLSLNNNQLEYLPEGIYKCKQLVSLSLDGNPGLDFPMLFERLKDLKNLKVLSLDNNEIVTIPNSIASLKNLEYLLVRGNSISTEELNKTRIAYPMLKIISAY